MLSKNRTIYIAVRPKQYIFGLETKKGKVIKATNLAPKRAIINFIFDLVERKILFGSVDFVYSGVANFSGLYYKMYEVK